jgi:hypothetical protein
LIFAPLVLWLFYYALGAANSTLDNTRPLDLRTFDAGKRFNLFFGEADGTLASNVICY